MTSLRITSSALFAVIRLPAQLSILGATLLGALASPAGAASHSRPLSVSEATFAGGEGHPSDPARAARTLAMPSQSLAEAKPHPPYVMPAPSPRPFPGVRDFPPKDGQITVSSARCTAIDNCSFETGAFPNWIPTDLPSPFLALQIGGAGINPGFGLFTSDPTDGALAALLGFDGAGPGTITVAQEVTLPAAAVNLNFDYRAGWDMVSFGGSTLPRTFSVDIEPTGGGPPLASRLLLTAPPATRVLDTGALSGAVNVNTFAGRSVRVVFRWLIPENFSGPAFFQLDNVTLSETPCRLDSLPPQFTVPTCGAVQTVEAGVALAIPVSAFDPDRADSVSLSASLPAGASFTSAGGNPATGTFGWTPSAADSGCHRVRFDATDGCRRDSCEIRLCVVTNRSPDCSGAVASETVVWPPNHSYHAISILGVTDPDGDRVAITVTGVTQDEPVNGRGDGNTCPDARIVDGQASVRAERAGTAGMPRNGRVYEISFTASDGRGGACNGSVSVCVPHDQGSEAACADDGQHFNSLACTGGGSVTPETITNVSLKVTGVIDGQANIEFALPSDAQVQVAVYDVAGRTVAKLEDAMLPTGVHERAWNTAGVPRGLYFVRLKAGEHSLTKTVIKTR